MLDPVGNRIHPVYRFGPERAVSYSTFRFLLLSQGTIRGSMRRHNEVEKDALVVLEHVLRTCRLQMAAVTPGVMATQSFILPSAGVINA